MTMREDLMDCPFCGYQATEYGMLLHLEELHAEGESPFVARNEPQEENTEDDQYAECPIEGCGEVLLLEEMDYHVELHAEEQELDPADDAEAPTSTPQVTYHDKISESLSDVDRRQQNRTPISSRQAKSIQAWRQIFSMPSSSKRHDDRSSKSLSSVEAANQRLGKAELGKFAHEQRMPEWLMAHLQKRWGVKSKGVIPVLEQLLEQCPSTKYAYLCHPCVQHVSKLRKEGGFCGYRNIQMMVSYVIGAQYYGAEHFENELPSIFQIQESIEVAWDRGINAQGRIETGGVRGTRKYIGTPEAQAIFCSLNIPCEAQGFKDREPGRAEIRLLKEVEKYFQSGNFDPADKVRRTTLPPLYFQHAGHSMTIIGIERQRSGHINLLVFDPMFHDPGGITRLVDRQFEHRFPDFLLKPYRRGNKYLKKYKEFEVLRLRPRPVDLFQD